MSPFCEFTGFQSSRPPPRHPPPWSSWKSMDRGGLRDRWAGEAAGGSHAVLFPAKHREPALISPGLCLLVPKLAKVPALFLSPRHRWHLHPAESPGFFPGGDGNYQPRPAWMSSAPSEGISGLANESLRFKMYLQSPFVGGQSPRCCG